MQTSRKGAYNLKAPTHGEADSSIIVLCYHHTIMHQEGYPRIPELCPGLWSSSHLAWLCTK